jgi:hypothetical protein
MLVCEGVEGYRMKAVKCSGQASAIPGIFLYACTHTQVLIPKLKIIFKIIYSFIVNTLGLSVKLASNISL